MAGAIAFALEKGPTRPLPLVRDLRGRARRPMPAKVCPEHRHRNGKELPGAEEVRPKAVQNATG